MANQTAMNSLNAIAVNRSPRNVAFATLRSDVDIMQAMNDINSHAREYAESFWLKVPSVVCSMPWRGMSCPIRNWTACSASVNFLIRTSRRRSSNTTSEH